MKTAMIVCLLLAALIALSFFAAVNRTTIVYDSVGHYGLVIHQGTIVQVLERDAAICIIRWDTHQASIPCSHLTRLK